MTVRESWLPGFNTPCCHTMSVDGSMLEHGLMQAIAGANTSVDEQVRDSVRAQLRLLIKRLLREWNYPQEGHERPVDVGSNRQSD